MAVTYGKTPIIMTAVGDAIVGNWKVHTIRCVSESSGEFSLTDKSLASGGREILHSRSLQANDSDETFIGTWIDGLYVEDMPADGKVYVYYE